MSWVVRISHFVKKFRSSKHFLTTPIHEIPPYDSVRNGYRESCFLIPTWQKRLMTTSRRIQDRSKKKRVHDLEIVTENWKIVSKVLFVMEVLKKEPEQIIRLGSLERYRREINLKKPHRLSDFIRKSPKLFELYKDPRGVTWCGMTQEAEDLLEEEADILESHGDKVAEYVTRLLMMSVDKKIAIDKVAHFRRDFGLPADFRKNWAYKYPQYFRVVKSEENKDVEYLQLVFWNPAWAVTELEKKVSELDMTTPTPGVLSLAFPMKFPANYKRISRYTAQIQHFQEQSYLSPYADAQGLQPGSQEFDKRALAIMHELLSFTIEKRLVTDHLTHFRRELVMPQKLMRLLLKHCGIFYVSERGKRLSVFLTQGYDGSELIYKCPLVLWREKVLSLSGYRDARKSRTFESFNEFSDMEEHNNLFAADDPKDDENALQEIHEETISNLDGNDSDMELQEVFKAYTNNYTF